MAGVEARELERYLRAARDLARSRFIPDLSVGDYAGLLCDRLQRLDAGFARANRAALVRQMKRALKANHGAAHVLGELRAACNHAPQRGFQF